MIKLDSFRTCVLNPVLNKLQIHSKTMEDLLYVTAYCQTKVGDTLNTKYGYGIYGMTIQNHQAVWNDFLSNDVRFINLLMMHFDITPGKDLFYKLTSDLWYATAMAYFWYRMNKKYYDSLLLERGEVSDLLDIYSSMWSQAPFEKKTTDELIAILQPEKIKKPRAKKKPPLPSPDQADAKP